MSQYPHPFSVPTLYISSVQSVFHVWFPGPNSQCGVYESLNGYSQHSNIALGKVTKASTLGYVLDEVVEMHVRLIW